MLGIAVILAERCIANFTLECLTVKQVFLHTVRGCRETCGRPKVFQSRKESRICGSHYVAGRPGGFE